MRHPGAGNEPGEVVAERPHEDQAPEAAPAAGEISPQGSPRRTKTGRSSSSSPSAMARPSRVRSCACSCGARSSARACSPSATIAAIRGARDDCERQRRSACREKREQHMTVRTYCRRSKNDEGKQQFSLDVQAAGCSEMAARMGLAQAAPTRLRGRWARRR
jgi:hypothetical protein